MVGTKQGLVDTKFSRRWHSILFMIFKAVPIPHVVFVGGVGKTRDVCFQKSISCLTMDLKRHSWASVCLFVNFFHPFNEFCAEFWPQVIQVHRSAPRFFGWNFPKSVVPPSKINLEVRTMFWSRVISRIWYWNFKDIRRFLEKIVFFRFIFPFIVEFFIFLFSLQDPMLTR